MNTSKKLILSLAMIAGLSAMTALSPAVAGMGDRHHGMNVERMTKKLELTEQQSDQVKQLISEYATDQQRPSKEQMKEKRHQHRAELQALISASDFDEAALRVKMAQRAQKHQDSMVSRMKLQRAIYQVLNAGQQEKYLKMLEHRMGKMSGRGRNKSEHREHRGN